MNSTSTLNSNTPNQFNDHREAALALLAQMVRNEDVVTPKVGNFLGSCCAYRELTPRMTWWLGCLLRDGGLPPLAPHHTAVEAEAA